MQRQRSERLAFTLIELLVVVAIISMLAAILFPVFASARESARRTACISNLRQLGMAARMYHQDCDEFPPYLSAMNSAYVRDARIFVCPSDGQHGQYPGNPRVEGDLYLPSGVSYDYIPNWDVAQTLRWWAPAPAFGDGKWDDLTPLAACQWHWAKSFSAGLPGNTSGARGWELIVTAGASVRKIRVETPPAAFTPEMYQ